MSEIKKFCVELTTQGLQLGTGGNKTGNGIIRVMETGNP